MPRLGDENGRETAHYFSGKWNRQNRMFAYSATVLVDVFSTRVFLPVSDWKLCTWLFRSVRDINGSWEHFIRDHCKWENIHRQFLFYLVLGVLWDALFLSRAKWKYLLQHWKVQKNIPIKITRHKEACYIFVGEWGEEDFKLKHFPQKEKDINLYTKKTLFQEISSF